MQICTHPVIKLQTSAIIHVCLQVCANSHKHCLLLCAYYFPKKQIFLYYETDVLIYVIWDANILSSPKLTHMHVTRHTLSGMCHNTF